MAEPHKTVLLVSNTVMHYRVSVYNYFHQRFGEEGWEWRVLTDRLQSQSKIPPKFQIEEIPFNWTVYRNRIIQIKPDAVILFLHLKDKIHWPLIHWLKWKGIPVAVWTKTRNLDDLDNKFRNALFSYINSLSDGLIIYSADLVKYLTPRQRKKAFPANNTINEAEFPAIAESKDAIKKALNIPFKKVVLFVGRMDVDGGRKRVDHLIEIFRDLEGRDAGLVIVGSGMKPEWQARINPLTTIYLGEVHDPDNRQIARIFTMADLCSIPGHVGLGLNQALLYGLPTITMEGKQPPEIAYLHSGRNGYIVPAGDVAQLRHRILELLDNDSKRGEFSANARAVYQQEATVEGMFLGFQRCIDFITNKKTSKK